MIEGSPTTKIASAHTVSVLMSLFEFGANITVCILSPSAPRPARLYCILNFPLQVFLTLGKVTDNGVG